MGKSRFDTPREAEAAFYHAFGRADLAGMMAVWCASDDIECVHPFGPRLRGPRAVAASWREIFTNAPDMRIDPVVEGIIEGDGLAVHTVVEAISVGAVSNPTRMLATNVYRLTEQGWRMVIHHASPPPQPRRGAPPPVH